MQFEDYGRIRVVFRYQRKRYTEALRLDHTTKNMQIAQRIERDLKTAIRAGTFNRSLYLQFFPDGRKADQIFGAVAPAPETSAVPTLEEFARIWIEEHKVELSQSTEYDYRSVIRAHIQGSTLGDTAINKVDEGAIKTFIGSLQDKGVGTRRINYTIGRLRSIFAVAAKRFDFDSPMDDVKALRAPKNEVDPFTADEADCVCAAATGQDKAFVTLLIHSGLRPSEAMALSWPDIDFGRQFLIVRKNLTRFGMGIPKTPGSELRTVDLDAEVMAELRLQRERTGLMEGGAGLVFLADQGFAGRTERPAHYRLNPTTGARVLVHAFSQRITIPRGRRTGGKQTPLNLANFRRRNWARILLTAGVRPRTIYQCRHTFATVLLDSGEAARYIADQLGHRDLAMIVRHYGRWTKKPGRLLAGGFAQAAGRSGPNPDQIGGKHGVNRGPRGQLGS